MVAFQPPPRTQPRSAVLPPQTLSRGPWYSLCSQRLLTCVLPGFTSAWHNKALSWAVQISGLWSLIGRHFSFWRSAIDACGCSFGYERAKENSLYQESFRHPSFRWPKTVQLNHRLTQESTVFKPHALHKARLKVDLNLPPICLFWNLTEILIANVVLHMFFKIMSSVCTVTIFPLLSTLQPPWFQCLWFMKIQLCNNCLLEVRHGPNPMLTCAMCNY